MVLCMQNKTTHVHLLLDVKRVSWSPGNENIIADRKTYYLFDYNHVCVVGVLLIKEDNPKEKSETDSKTN